MEDKLRAGASLDCSGLGAVIVPATGAGVCRASLRAFRLGFSDIVYSFKGLELGLFLEGHSDLCNNSDHFVEVNK